MPNDVPLRDLIEQRWKDHGEVHRNEADARQRALDSMDHRLDGMNEFRQALNDVVNHSVTRENYEARHRELDRRIQAVEQDMVRQDALDAANAELARTRKALAYTIVAGVAVTIIAAGVDVLIRLGGG